MRLDNRTVLITGGSSGIGKGLAKALLQKGARVIITGRDPQRLSEAGRELPGVHTIVSDVSDPEAIRGLFIEVESRFPELDTLVNNAGIMRKIGLLDGRGLEDVTREVSISLDGPIRMVAQFLPLLRRQKAPLIVNVTSGLAFVPFRIAPIYSAAKAGLRAYTRCLRAQLAGVKVRVVEVAPPGTETPLFRGEFEAEMTGQKAMPVEALVRAIISGLEGNRAEITPGASRILKIASRLAPDVIFNQLARVG